MNFEKMRTWAEINLDNFKSNIEVIKKHIGDVKITAVLKADAYGHGVKEIAKEAVLCGVDCLAVACVDEAKELRNSGIKLPILILSHITENRIKELIDYDIMPTVFNRELSEKLSKCAKENNTVIKVHVKLDTGMTRLGFDSGDVEKTIDDILYLSNLDNIEINGIFTHLADADNEDNTYTDMQYKKYIHVINELEKRGLKSLNKHVCNSAAAIAEKNMYHDMLRCGIILYGYYPDKHLEKIMPGLKPVMELKSTIFQIREMKENAFVSYGCTYKAHKNQRIGVVPIGYADGYSRQLSDDFYVLTCGKKANIIGRICMDQMMIDLSDIPEAKEGDTVVIIGKSEGLSITADDIADKLNTISYEVLCNISRRVSRVYLKNNEVDSIVNYLE